MFSVLFLYSTASLLPIQFMHQFDQPMYLPPTVERVFLGMEEEAPAPAPFEWSEDDI